MIREPEFREYSPGQLEEKIERFWEENNTYEKVKKLRENGPKYYFLDGLLMSAVPYTSEQRGIR